VVLVLALALALCLAPAALADDLPVTIVQTDTIAQIQRNIQGAIDDAKSGDTVTVSGSKSGAEVTLALSIPAGVKVVWRANYAGGAATLIWIEGAGTFEVAAGIVAASGEKARAISSNSCRIMVSYASIMASGKEGRAISTDSGDITVSGGTVIATLGDAIYTNSGDITVNDNALVQAGGTVASTESGNVTVAGGTVLASGKGGLAIWTGSGDVTVTGGTVSAGAEDGSAIYSEKGNVTVSGGTVTVGPNEDHHKVIGVITGIAPVNIWVGAINAFAPQYQKVTILNTGNKEVTYTFSPDFREAYNRWLNGDGSSGANFTAGNFYTTFTDDSYWKDTAISGKLGEPVSQFGFREGDIVELLLDDRDSVGALANYAFYDNTGGPVKVNVNFSRERIIFNDMAYTLTKDTVVYKIAVDDNKDARIVTVNSVLAADFEAAKIVAFDRKANDEINVLYYISAIPSVKAGVVTRFSYNQDGGSYFINGEWVKCNGTALTHLPAVVGYYIKNGEAVICSYLTDATYNPTLANIAAFEAAGNYGAAVGIASYNSGVNSNISFYGSNRYYFDSDTYVHNLISNEMIKSTDYRDELDGARVIAIYDQDFDLVLVAVVGGLEPLAPAYSGAIAKAMAARPLDGTSASASASTPASAIAPASASAPGPAPAIAPIIAPTPTPAPKPAPAAPTRLNTSFTTNDRVDGRGDGGSEADGGGAAIFAAHGHVTVSGGTVNSAYGDAIYTISGNVIISGDAIVRTSGLLGNTIITGNGNVAVSGGAVTASGDSSTAIFSDDGKVTVSDGRVVSSGIWGDAIYACSGGVTVSGGTVVASDEIGWAIRTDNGNVTVAGNAIVQASGLNGCAISTYNGEVAVGGGMVVSSSKDGYTIVNYRGHVTVSGGTVTASGDRSCVIYSNDGEITVNGGTVESSGEQGYAIVAFRGNVEVNHGTVSSVSGLAIRSDTNVTVNGGRVESSGFNGDTIFGFGNANITGGTVFAGGPYGYAINIAKGSVNMSGGTVFASGEGGVAIVISPAYNYDDEGNETVLVGDLTISGGTVSASGEKGVAISSRGKVKVNGGKVNGETAISVNGGENIGGVAAYLAGTCSGSFTTYGNQGLIIEVASLNAGAAGTTDGLTVKAGAVSARWIAGGFIEFTLGGSLQPRTILWASTVEPGDYTGIILYQDSTRPAIVTLLNSEGYPIGSAETDKNGAYTLSAVAGTAYTLIVTKPGYLSYTIKNLTLTEGEDIKTVDIRQLAGDVNGDGIINAVDLTQLLSEFNREPVEYKEADIDGNGIVNAADLTYLLAGFNKRNVLVYE
jgi:hypothetical protein